MVEENADVTVDILDGERVLLNVFDGTQEVTVTVDGLSLISAIESCLEASEERV